MHKLLFPLILIVIALSSACSAEVLNVGTNNPDNADGNPACAGVSTTPQLLFSPDADETVAIDSIVADGEYVYLLQRSGDIADAATSTDSKGSPTLVRVPVAGGRRTLLAYDDNVAGDELALDAKHVYTVTGGRTATNGNDNLLKRHKNGQQLVSTRMPEGRSVYGLVANSLGWLAWFNDAHTAVLLKNPETNEVTALDNAGVPWGRQLIINSTYLYWETSGQSQLQRMELRSSRVDAVGQSISDVQVDDQFVYGHISNPGIYSRPKSSSVWREFHPDALVGLTFKLSGDYLYWVGTTINALREPRSLWRARKDGTGALELLQRDVGLRAHVAIDQCRIYWTRETAAGQIVESRRK